MTTLELARQIAQAARLASSEQAAAVAIFDVMHETRSWFTRVREVEGLTVETHYEQPDLFNNQQEV